MGSRCNGEPRAGSGELGVTMRSWCHGEGWELRETMRSRVTWQCPGTEPE